MARLRVYQILLWRRSASGAGVLAADDGRGMDVCRLWFGWSPARVDRLLGREIDKEDDAVYLDGRLLGTVRDDNPDRCGRDRLTFTHQATGALDGNR